MATPACNSTCLLVKVVISCATSRSSRPLRAASAFSMLVARLAAAKDNRFCAAPTPARAVFSVSIAELTALDARLALLTVSIVLLEMASTLVLAR